MESIYFVVKVAALLWVGAMFFIFVMGSNASEKDDRFSSSVLFGTMSAFLPAIQFGTYQGTTGTGYFSAGFPFVSYGGFLLIAIGAATHAAGILTLKKQWSSVVVIASNHKLIDTGLYKFIRHPIYTGILLELLGFGLAVSNWISILILVIPNCAGLAYRIHTEEQVLRRHFGDAYLAYERHTKRFVPWVF